MDIAIAVLSILASMSSIVANIAVWQCHRKNRSE